MPRNTTHTQKKTMSTQEKLTYIGKKYALNRGTIDETHVLILDIRTVYGRTDALVRNDNGIEAWRTFYAAHTVDVEGAQ